MKNKKTAGVSGSHNILAWHYIKIINYVKGNSKSLTNPDTPEDSSNPTEPTVA
ncbi:MAG TPA: hypothetical protein VK879_16225 [Candidatus Sulfomarinibacteraceae bacterium]|nr:hypothetical protein [Candidatus Sulfomarinibacteraceae bacterium]